MDLTRIRKRFSNPNNSGERLQFLSQNPNDGGPSKRFRLTPLPVLAHFLIWATRSSQKPFKSFFPQPANVKIKPQIFQLNTPAKLKT